MNFNERALHVDEQVTTEMDRLYYTAELNLCYVPLDTIDATSHFQIIYKNCRVLHKHVREHKEHEDLTISGLSGFLMDRWCIQILIVNTQSLFNYI